MFLEMDETLEHAAGVFGDGRNTGAHYTCVFLEMDETLEHTTDVFGDGRNTGAHYRCFWRWTKHWSTLQVFLEMDETLSTLQVFLEMDETLEHTTDGFGDRRNTGAHYR